MGEIFRQSRPAMHGDRVLRANRRCAGRFGEGAPFSSKAADRAGGLCIGQGMRRGYAEDNRRYKLENRRKDPENLANRIRFHFFSLASMSLAGHNAPAPAESARQFGSKTWAEIGETVETVNFSPYSRPMSEMHFLTTTSVRVFCDAAASASRPCQLDGTASCVG